MANPNEYQKSVTSITNKKVSSGHVSKRDDVGVPGDDLGRYTCTSEFCDVYNEAAKESGLPEMPRYAGNAQMYEAWKSGDLPWLNYSKELPENQNKIIGITKGGIDKGHAASSGNYTHVYNYLGEQDGRFNVYGSPGGNKAVYKRNIAKDNTDDNRYYITLNDDYLDNSQEKTNFVNTDIENIDSELNTNTEIIEPEENIMAENVIDKPDNTKNVNNANSYADILRGMEDIMGIDLMHMIGQ